MKKLVVAFLAVMFMPSVFSETYTISPPASLDSCNEEFENIANTLQPGDELILNDGVYSQGCARRIAVNGTAENPIVIRAADGASPLITRPNSTSFQNNNIEISGSHYTIRGLRFQYGSSGVRFLGSNNITFENNKIFDTLNNALTMNSGVTDSHILRNNEIYNTGLASGSTEGEGMYIGKHSGGSEGTNHLIENNYIHDLRATSSGGNDGIEIKFGSGGNTVRGNVIHDTNIGQQFPCVFVYGHGEEPNIIENNLLYNCGEAILVTADAIIRNNVILNSSISGIHLRVQSPAPNVQNVTIVNNTVFGSHPICAQLRIGSAPNIVVANNAFYCEGSTAISGNGFANATLSNNVVRGNVSGLAVDNIQVILGTLAAENFIDSSMQDFRLLSDSTLIDAGASVANMGTEDFAGNARISGSSVDVGAHEYSSSGSSPDEPTLTFTGPSTVTENTVATLQWATTNATSCTASGGWAGSRPTSGSEQTNPLAVDTTFTLSCTGDGGTVTESIQIAVTPVAPDEPTLTFSGPVSVTENTTATLQWATTDATSCTASGGWTGSRPTSGSEQTAPLAVDTTFILSCSGDGGTVTESIRVTVTAAPPDEPTLTFTGPLSVTENTAATLQWATTNATSCTASGGWSGNKPTSGSEQTAPLLVDTTFVLACTGPGGTVTESTRVLVTSSPPPPVAPTLNFTGPASVINNTAADLQWTTTNATNCTASGDWSGNKPTSGSEQTVPLTDNSRFTLACSGPGGSVSSTVQVTVTAPPPDSDGDGLLDTWEQQYFGNLDEDGQGDGDADSLVNLDEFAAGTDPTNPDTDGEGLPDGEEVILGTDPLLQDTDGDGSDDFVEVRDGSDPNDSTSVPPVAPPPQAPELPIDESSSGGGALHPAALLVLLLLGLGRSTRRRTAHAL